MLERITQSFGSTTFRSHNMITSHALHNPHILALPLLPRIAAFNLRASDIKSVLGFRVSAQSRGFRVLSPATRVFSAMADSKPEEEAQKVDPVVQYIVLRKDLVETLKWPLGSVISQGCHAAVAAVWLFKDDPVTLEYCSTENLDHMHKVTLEVKGETQLVNLAKKLEAGGVAHKLWTEQPENYPTCLATKPYRKSEVASYFKSLKLCR